MRPKYKKVFIILGLFLLVCGSANAACNNNSDCESGDKCIERSDDSAGMCITIITDKTGKGGNVFHSTNPKSKKIKNCVSDEDCDEGYSCLLKKGQAGGFCGIR